MKWVIVAGFLLCFVDDIHGGALQTSDLLPGKECLPGTQWTSQCNQCSCSDEGLSVCTVQLCEGYENEKAWRCLPDTAWKNDCNTCWCNSKGQVICTRVGCGVHFVKNFEPTGGEPVKEPEENSSIPDVDYGVNYLLDEDFGDHELMKRSVCEPNELFEVDCNSCKCDSNGQSYECTQSECLEIDMDKEVEVFKETDGADHVELHSVCQPRATFHVGCNTCQCNNVGTDFTCATKPCALLNDVEIFPVIKAFRSPPTDIKAVVCAANRMFIKDCNTCWCNDDGTSYFCTRKVCVPELPDEITTEEPEELNVIKRQCRPDEVFELDCNMCRCNADGKSFSCTRRACLPEEEGKNASLVRKTRAAPQTNSRSEHVKETPKNCKPGLEFRIDCNKCLCDNEGADFSCTRIDCAALNNNNNGGVRRKRDTESDFRCSPGEQFKRACSDCTCSADGRSYFCTPRLCEEQIIPLV